MQAAFLPLKYAMKKPYPKVGYGFNFGAVDGARTRDHRRDRPVL